MITILKKNVSILFIIIFISSCVHNKIKDKQGEDDFTDYTLLKSWFMISLYDKQDSIYGTNEFSDRIRFKLLEKNGQRYFWTDYDGLHKLIKIDTLKTNDNLVYRFLIDSIRTIETKVVNVSDGKFVVYEWISDKSNNPDMDQEVVRGIGYGQIENVNLTSTEEYRALLTTKRGMPKELNNKVLLPTIYHNNQYWIDPLFKEKKITITDNDIDINDINDGVYYHFGDIVQVTPDFWELDLNKENLLLQIKRRNDNGQSFYNVIMSNRATKGILYHAGNLVIEDLSLFKARERETINSGNFRKLKMANLNISTPIYVLPYTAISNRYLREDKSYANIIEGENEYLTFKRGISLTDTKPLFDRKGIVSMNGKGDYPVRFLVFKLDASEGYNDDRFANYLFLATVDFEGLKKVFYEGIIEMPSFAELTDISLTKRTFNSEDIFFDSENKQEYLKTYKGSIGNTLGGFILSVRIDKKNSYYYDEESHIVPQYIQLIYDWAYERGYTGHEDLDYIGYTWLLNQVLVDGSPVSLDSRDVIKIKDDDYIYPLMYIGVDSY